mgnify:CR=1 FL=1
MSERLSVVRIELGEANAFVERYHRHHRPVVGHLFSIGATLADQIVGVAGLRDVVRDQCDALLTTKDGTNG